MIDEEKAFNVRRASEIYNVANDIMTQRMSYGMVAQSMLLLSYVTLFTNQEKMHTYSVILEIVFSLLGLFYSAFQFARVRTTSERLYRLRDTLIEDDPIFAKFWNAYSPAKWTRIRQHHVAAAFATAWLMLLAIALFSG